MTPPRNNPRIIEYAREMERLHVTAFYGQLMDPCALIQRDIQKNESEHAANVGHTDRECPLFGVFR